MTRRTWLMLLLLAALAVAAWLAWQRYQQPAPGPAFAEAGLSAAKLVLQKRRSAALPRELTARARGAADELGMADWLHASVRVVEGREEAAAWLKL